MTGGLQFQASYTEARATDGGQSSQTFTSANNVLNPFDLGLEEGTSNFEIRHRFVANAVWNPTTRTQSGALNTVSHGPHDIADFGNYVGSPPHGDVDR